MKLVFIFKNTLVKESMLPAFHSEIIFALHHFDCLLCYGTGNDLPSIQAESLLAFLHLGSLTITVLLND